MVKARPCLLVCASFFIFLEQLNFYPALEVTGFFLKSRWAVMPHFKVTPTSNVVAPLDSFLWRLLLKYQRNFKVVWTWFVYCVLPNTLTVDRRTERVEVILFSWMSSSSALSHLTFPWKTFATSNEEVWFLCFLRLFVPKKTQAACGDSQRHIAVYSLPKKKFPQQVWPQAEIKSRELQREPLLCGVKCQWCSVAIHLLHWPFTQAHPAAYWHDTSSNISLEGNLCLQQSACKS